MKNYIYYFFIFGQISFAQKSVKVTYEMIRTFPDSFFNNVPVDQRTDFKANFAKPIFSRITNNGEYSLLEAIESKDIVISSKEQNSLNEINLGTTIKKLNTWRLKDVSKNQLFIKAELNNKMYYIQRDCKKPKIYFTNTEIEIDKIKCKYAFILSDKNPLDTIKYWYAKDIPIDDNLNEDVGFPGLVLKYQTKNAIAYAVKIEFFDYKIELPVLDKSFTVVDPETYQKLKTASEQQKTFIDKDGRENTINSIKMNSK